MSVHDAEPGDIYVDSRGRLWRIVGTWHEPVVIAEEIERHNATPQRQTAGVSGLLWHGFERIYRPAKPPKTTQTGRDGFSLTAEQLATY